MSSPVLTREPLPTSTPEAQGVDPAGITAFLDTLEAADDIEPHSLMVLRHGHVVAAGWWAPYTPEQPHLLYSLSKSFTSTAAGFAVAEGLLDLDATVLSYFPELDADITDARSRSMKVRHVAAMASGHLTETVERAVRTDPAEPIRGFLLTPPERDPGTVFAYNQPCTYALAAIIQRQSGQTLVEYLRPRLFEPLGIDQAGWQTDHLGRELGFTGLHTTTDAIARLGLLYLQRGSWGGRQLLSEAWVEQATRTQVANPDEPNPDWRQGYGYQFWMARHGYRGDGAYGQFCIVLPEVDVVVASTAETTNMQGILDAVWEHLLPAFGTAPGPGSASPTALPARLSALSLPTVDGAPEPSGPGWPDTSFSPGRGAELQPSLSAVDLEHGPRGWSLTLLDAGEHLTVDLGTGRWATNLETTDHGRTGVPMAASGGWVDDDRLSVEVIFLETPHRLALDISRSARRFDLEWRTVPLRSGTLAELRMPR